MTDYYFRCRSANNKTTRPDVRFMYHNLTKREFLDIVHNLVINYHEVTALRISGYNITMYTTDMLFRLLDNKKEY